MAAIHTLLSYLLLGERKNLLDCAKPVHMVAGSMIYGGTHALFQNFYPKIGIKVDFAQVDDIGDFISKVKEGETKVVYVETAANPKLTVADITALAEVAHSAGAKLVVDNTFLPLSVTPRHFGADYVIHSLTKFFGGESRHMGGGIGCKIPDVEAMLSLSEGPLMLTGPVMDPKVADDFIYNLRTLPLRIKEHSRRALFYAKNLEELGLNVIYPGLDSHPDHQLIKEMLNRDYGYGGIMVLDVGSKDKAYKLISNLQMVQGIAYCCVSLGFHIIQVSCSARTTSSEISQEEQNLIGLSDGALRFSIGYNDDMEYVWERFLAALKAVHLI
jgi:methionine-gamma-lyase